eukprot:13298229-Ditylum_brightwellii.AAC.1
MKEEHGIFKLGIKYWLVTKKLLQIRLQRIELAWLNASLGGKCVSSAVYPLAASYFESGRARCFADKHNAYFTLVNARVAQGKLHEAIRVG